jgi:hypothetical protein
MSEHNELVAQNEFQKDPYRAKASEFPVKSVKAGNGQSGGAHGDSEGNDMLVKQSENQLAPRANESVDVDGPSEWGKGGKAFSASVASEGSTAVDNPCGVDLATGEQTCKGYKKTKVGEVIDPKVSIG